MDAWIGLARAIHILAMVFMAWPLYALITVNERGGLGPPLGDRADRYMENIIRGMTVRCLAFQVTALLSGLVLIGLRGMGWAALMSSPVLLLKVLLLLVLMSLLGYVHFRLQPRLDALFASAPEGPITGDLGSRISALRLGRKRIAATCLFLVMTLVILGLQVYTRFPIALTVALFAAAAGFARQAFRSKIRYGWF